MHMANELLSGPVAAGTWALSAGALGWVCRKVSQTIGPDRLSLMGVLGAFVFAAQMINIPLPFLPGTSGHMIGAVLLAIVLGPHAGALAVSSVVIVQCLLFQDGGLLAMGCNLINMALIPAYLGYALYRGLTKRFTQHWASGFAILMACLITTEISATLVVIQAGLSGVVDIPLYFFLVTMLGVHLLVGILEGVLTVMVIGYLTQMKPDIFMLPMTGRARLSQRALLGTLLVFTLIVGGLLSLWASERPDGLEWSYAERPDQPGFSPIIHNESSVPLAADRFQDRIAVLPDYSKPISLDTSEATEAAAGWTSLAGLAGSLITMGSIWLCARILRRRAPTVNIAPS